MHIISMNCHTAFYSLDSERRRRRSGIAGAGLSLYARLISHFNITNMVFNYLNNMDHVHKSPSASASGGFRGCNRG